MTRGELSKRDRLLLILFLSLIGGLLLTVPYIAYLENQQTKVSIILDSPKTERTQEMKLHIYINEKKVASVKLSDLAYDAGTRQYLGEYLCQCKKGDWVEAQVWTVEGETVAAFGEIYEGRDRLVLRSSISSADAEVIGSGASQGHAP